MQRRNSSADRTPAVAVLVDKFTFSAALVTAALLKFHAHAKLVGEEMGDAAAFHAEGGMVELPQSGMSTRYSDGWHDWEQGKPDPVLTPPEIARDLRLPPRLTLAECDQIAKAILKALDEVLAVQPTVGS